MDRGAPEPARSRRILQGAVLCAAVAALSSLPAGVAANARAGGLFTLSHFPGQPDIPLRSYVAIRRLSASARGGKMQATALVRTSLDPVAGMTYRILHEEGESSIRRRVFRGVLDGERKASREAGQDGCLLSPANYEFSTDVDVVGGLVRVGMTPRREHPMLVVGSMFVRPDDGDVVRIEGRLAKRPSFWTRRVDVVHQFARVGGVRVPISVESVAQILFVGTGTFTMTWEYESVNGAPVSMTARRVEPGATIAP